MIIYNVTVNVDEDVLPEWLKWMSRQHIPDVMKTGLFVECKLSKILAEEAGGKSYSVQYLLENWNNYHDYQSNMLQNFKRNIQINLATNVLLLERYWK